MLRTQSNDAARRIDVPVDVTPPSRVVHVDLAWRGHRLIVVLLAAIFFFTPAALYLAGMRPQEIENHPLAGFPSITSAQFFSGLSSWATDNLPFRSLAVRGNAAIAELLFQELPTYGAGGDFLLGTPPSPSEAEVYPKVIRGNDGWLYYGEDTRLACQSKTPIERLISRYRRLGAAITASGRRFVLTFPPDKSTMVPSHLPADYLGKECAAQRKSMFWAQLEADPPAGLVDVRNVLANAGDAAYLKLDTHWTPLGTATYVMALTKAISPRLLEGTHAMPTGHVVAHTGDLSVFLGLPEEETSDAWTIDRSGVVAAYDALQLGNTPTEYRNATVDAPLFEPKTVVIGDSFSVAAWPFFVSFFRDVSFVLVSAPAKTLVNQICDSQVVILEVVERNAVSGPSVNMFDADMEAIASCPTVTR